MLKALLNNGLKISSKKCQVLERNYNILGIPFFNDKTVCVKLLRSRLEAIQKLKPPTTVKGCRSFRGMANFLSLFCPELQKLLQQISNLTRKGRQFILEEEQQNAFDEMKRILQKPPVLHLLDNKGRFHSYSDTNTFSQEVLCIRFRMANEN